MNFPGFDAELSLGPTIGRYSRNRVADRLGAVIQPALERHRRCTTIYAGYVTYPLWFCESPYIEPFSNVASREPGDSASAAMSGRVQFSRVPTVDKLEVPTVDKLQVGSLPKFCQTRGGPWWAYVQQQESCNTFEPDDFTLTISGVPQPVELRWKGTMEDAPSTVGAIGSLSVSHQTCSCCGGMKQCPDGSCKPPWSSCEVGSPT